MDSHARQRLLYAVTVRPKSLYEDVHASTGHPGYNQQNTIGANYTDKDAAAARDIIKDMHSAVLTSILLIITMLNQLSHTTLVKSSSSMPSHTTVLEPQDLYMLTSSPTSHHARYIQSSPSSSLSQSSLLAWLSYFIHILNGNPMDQLLTARSRWIWKPVISQLSLQSTVTVSAIVLKPHPHVTNMLMVSLRGQ